MDNHDGAVKLYLKGDLVYLRLSLDYIRVSVHVTSARDINGFAPDFTTALSADPTGTTLITPVIGYHSDNLLGTVSQSAGVPTGAVIEAGSNANGNYTKFADGTMICTHSVELNNISTLALYDTWTFPVVFASAPKVSHVLNQGLSSDSTLPIHLRFNPATIAPSTSTVSLRTLSGDGSNWPVGSFMNTYAIAIGRWF